MLGMPDARRDEEIGLTDLQAIADQLGLDGTRRLRKADLIDSILGDDAAEEEREHASAGNEQAEEVTAAAARAVARAAAATEAAAEAIAGLSGERPSETHVSEVAEHIKPVTRRGETVEKAETPTVNNLFRTAFPEFSRNGR